MFPSRLLVPDQVASAFCCMQTCQQTMQVLYAEVQGRSMEPADPRLSLPLSQVQADCKAQGNNSCCLGTPVASCAAASNTHASAEPAEPQRSNAQAHATTQADATSLPQTTAPDASSDSAELAPSNSSTAQPAVDQQQANLGASSAQQVDSNTESVCGTSRLQQQFSETQQSDVAVEAATSTTSSDANGCVSGQIAGYTWRLPAAVQQEDCVMMWLGPQDAAALTHLQLTFNKWVP